MSDQKPSSTSRQTGTKEDSKEALAQKGYVNDRRGYTPLGGQLLPVAPSTSTGESGPVASTSANQQPLQDQPKIIDLMEALKDSLSQSSSSTSTPSKAVKGKATGKP